MTQYYYVLNKIPDLTLSKYASLDGGDVSGVLKAHENFWRQMNRRGLLNGESFHVFYEYNPDRPVGSRLKIGIRFDTPAMEDTFIAENVLSSALSPFYSLNRIVPHDSPSDESLNFSRRYRYGSHLIKKERFLTPKEYGQDSYYLTSEWKVNENARLYTMSKLMAAVNQPCLYVVSIYPRESVEEMTKRLDKTMNELRNSVRPQVHKSSVGVGIQGKDEHAKSALDFYEDLLDRLAENPHFLVDVRVLSNNLQHACLILDAAASEALEEGSHDQVTFEENISLAEVGDDEFVVCASAAAPETLNCLPQLFILEELAHFAVFPTLYQGEWVEIQKETVPEDHGSGLSIGIDETGHEVFFPLKNLSKHAFLAGVPGSGKTNAMMHLINAMHGTYGIPVLIFEPAKHEYRAITCVKGLEDIELFSPSAATRFPLHINPFEFPKGMTLAEHIRNLIAVFDGAFSLDPPMPFLLDASVEEVYADAGWMPSMINLGELRYPTMGQLYEKLAQRLEQTDYGPEIKGNLKSALQVRIGSLITREMADIFDVPKSTVKPEDWLNRSAIIELESMGKDPANFTTLLIATLIRETLKTINYDKPEDGRPRHVMFFEEAHNLIGPTAQLGVGQDADPKIAATAYIVKMLAEVRALGEGIVIADQLPTAMAPEVIKNTSLKIGLRITAQDDRQLLGGTMNANPDQLEKLSIFSPGHALISYEPLLKPFEVQLPYFEAKEGELSDKAVLLKMVKTNSYWDNISRSLDISSAKWDMEKKRILGEFRKVMDVLNRDESELRSIPESKLTSEQKSLAKEKKKAFEDIVSLRDSAERLCLQIYAYNAPLHFIHSIKLIKSKDAEIMKRIEGMSQRLKLLMQDSVKFAKEITGALSGYRERNGAEPCGGEKFKCRRELFWKSGRLWNDM